VSLRLGKLPPYLFAEIDAARDRARARGVDVIDLGVGDPDRPTPKVLQDVAATAVRNPEWHRYPPGNGSRRLREAVARRLRRRHGVEVDPDREVLVLIGSKEGIAHLPLALATQGPDSVLVPDLGYPVYTQGAILAGCEPRPYHLGPDRAFLPDPGELAALADATSRLLWLCYPHNPTGAEAGAAIFAALAAALPQPDLVIANDAAYLEMTLDAHRSVSLLEAVDHQERRVVEFHSLSKTFNMTGWRLGYAVGHREVIAQLARVKQSIDSGVFGALQEVGAFALGEICGELIAGVVAPYPRRRATIAGALQQAGIEVFPAHATFYVWARVPEGEDSLGFCARVLERTGVVVTPGVGFGPGGEGWFRVSLTAPDARIDEAARRLQEL